MPRASLRSVLLICAFNAARMCRVSTQITGSSASASALNSHCDSGPASSPIRLKWWTGFFRTYSDPAKRLRATPKAANVSFMSCVYRKSHPG
jgi:hypothetical protein